MRSSVGDGTFPRARRAWETPTITKLPIRTETRSSGAHGSAADSGPESPPPPAAPASKLGFAFEMSFPMAVRTE
jgi:hypothetical protein